MRRPVVPTWWSRSPAPGNLGDVLTPVVLQGLGVPVAWAELSGASLLGIGSILRFATAHHAVLGSGAMWAHDAPSPEAQYLAVRGPLSMDVVRRAGGDCPEVFGDLALLLPLVHDTPVVQRHELGIVPHYVDEADARAAHPGVHVISTLSADPLAVVDQIRSCRSIASSSLHGLIVAHAYGIPAAWYRFSGRLDGDDTKFRDYGLSVGLDLAPAYHLATAKPVVGAVDLGPLLDAVGTFV